MTDSEKDAGNGTEAAAARRAVTVGSATVDIITVIADRDVEQMTMTNVTASFLLLEQGRKTDAESITIHPGGGAVNTAVCLSRLGFSVTPIVKLGNDLNAAKVLEAFSSEDLSQALVRRTDQLDTGITVMVSSHDRDATIFTFRGANTLIEADDVPDQAFEGAELVHVSGLSNSSADQFSRIVGLARRAGAQVSVNPGIRQLTSRREAFLASLPDIDLLSINRVEAEALMPALAVRAGDDVAVASSGKVASASSDDATDLMQQPVEKLQRRGLGGSGFQMSLGAFCGALHELGPRYVAITDGTDGAYLSDAGALYFVPPLEVEPAGTAGAGDAFAATLAAKLASGAAPEAALASAAANASSVVRHVDTQTGLLGPTALGNIICDAPDSFRPRRLL